MNQKDRFPTIKACKMAEAANNQFSMTEHEVKNNLHITTVTIVAGEIYGVKTVFWGKDEDLRRLRRHTGKARLKCQGAGSQGFQPP
jgi:hypothetical protein